MTLAPVELTDVYETLVFDTSYDIDPAALGICMRGHLDPVEPIKLLPEEDAEGDGTGADGTEDDGTGQADPGPDDGDGTGSDDRSDAGTGRRPPTPRPRARTRNPPPTGRVATRQPLTAPGGADHRDAHGPPRRRGDPGPRAGVVAGDVLRGVRSVRGVADSQGQPTPPIPKPPLPLPVPSPTAVGTGDFKIQPITGGGIGGTARLRQERDEGHRQARGADADACAWWPASTCAAGEDQPGALLELHGGAGFDGTSFEAGSEHGLSANVDANIAFPVDLTVPIGGVVAPLAVTFNQRLLVKTAFSSKARRSWRPATRVRGRLQDGHRERPPDARRGHLRVSVRKSLLDSARGVALGPAGHHHRSRHAGDGRHRGVRLRHGPLRRLHHQLLGHEGLEPRHHHVHRWVARHEHHGGVGYSIPKPIVSGINLFLRAPQPPADQQGRRHRVRAHQPHLHQGHPNRSRRPTPGERRPEQLHPADPRAEKRSRPRRRDSVGPTDESASSVRTTSMATSP